MGHSIPAIVFSHFPQAFKELYNMPNKTMIVSGSAYWASVVAPNTTFDSDGVWEINVCNLDEDTVADLEAEGVDVKNKDDEKGNYVLAKRRVKRKGGDVNSPPKVVDSNNTPMHNTLIGNGSLVNVKFSPYEWTFGNKQGIGLDLQAVQVIDLVEYTTGAEDFEPVSGGYQSSDEDIPFPTN
tara:strand:- start:3733 stop:4278 length:546 start_codon:yes stop_codon:yes gene_type:complete